MQTHTEYTEFCIFSALILWKTDGKYVKQKLILDCTLLFVAENMIYL